MPVSVCVFFRVHLKVCLLLSGWLMNGRTDRCMDRKTHSLTHSLTLTLSLSHSLTLSLSHSLYNCLTACFQVTRTSTVVSSSLVILPLPSPLCLHPLASLHFHHGSLENQIKQAVRKITKIIQTLVLYYSVFLLLFTDLSCILFPSYFLLFSFLLSFLSLFVPLSLVYPLFSMELHVQYTYSWELFQVFLNKLS